LLHSAGTLFAIAEKDRAIQEAAFIMERIDRKRPIDEN
jgi:hypothetical protein